MDDPEGTAVRALDSLRRLDRGRWRRVLLVVGVLPLLVALAYTAMVVRVLAVQHSGNGAYADQRYLDAAGSYRSAGHWNPFEDWVAAFDAGAARHAQGQLHSALAAYEAALDFGVPHRDDCTVRINMALAHEALGDQATKKGRVNEADDEYSAGIDALEVGHCPTDSGQGRWQTADAKRVDERLHKKLRHNQQQQQQQQQQKQEQRQKQKQQQQKNKHQSKQQRQKQREKQRRQRQKQQQQEKRREQQEKKREQKLRQQNQQGLKQRKKQQGRDQGFGSEPSW